MDRQKISQELKKDNTKQPVACPWVANQPYPSSLSSKNRNGGQKRNSNSQTNCINNHWETSSSQNGCSQHNENSTFSSMQQSSNQFFLFLRLMQLFPHTHPATLHSVLYICKNDFFCAIDKLLYAKRCKILYNNRRTQIHHQKTTEKFTIVNQNHNSEYPIKRQFSKSADDENESDREAKIAKISEQDRQIDKQEIIHSDGVKLCENRSDIETPVDPVGTIKFITIKTNNIQEKQNISALENVDLKFDQVIL